VTDAPAGTPPIWDERYRTPEHVYGTAPNDFLAEVAGQIPAGPVLSIADGEGRNGVYLATLGHAVTSVDASSVGLAKARQLATTRGVAIETIVADLADYVIAPGAWSGIVSIFCHLPRPLRQRVHAQVVRGLAPGGLFVFEAYSVRQIGYGTGGPSSVELLPTLAALRSELAGLELLHAEELERDVHEGTAHTGRSVVVQVIGRKPG
jgi:SAM-dependent methyltransferase